MADCFEKYINENHSSVDDIEILYDEVILKNDCIVKHLIEKGDWSWIDFVSYITNNNRGDNTSNNNNNNKPLLVWMTPDCCCFLPSLIDKSDAIPSTHTYSIEVSCTIVTTTSNNNNDSTSATTTTTTTKLIVSSTHVNSTSSTIYGIFMLCSNINNKSSSSNNNIELTFKCFARQPRTPLVTLSLADFRSISTIKNYNALSMVRFHFVLLDKETLQTLTSSICNINISNIELRQCDIMDGAWDLALLQQQQQQEQLTQRQYKGWTISCTMPEFTKFAVSVEKAIVEATTTATTLSSDKTSSNTSSFKQLNLILHFWLDSKHQSWKSFTNALLLATTTTTTTSSSSSSILSSLEELSILYLDINDDGWIQLCNSLQNMKTLKKLKLNFTENFVDTFRKLTSERRTLRTKAILDLIINNTSIQYIDWPIYQQDDTIMIEINNHLNERRNLN